MATDPNPENGRRETSSNAMKRLRAAAITLTVLGVCIFGYFIYTTGLAEIAEGAAKVGVSGFALILFIYLLRILSRAIAWRMSVYEPYTLSLKDTFPAVIIGEALSSIIPLGILISGTAKAVAVRRKVPLVVGLSSVATENLFYSLVTGIFICLGAVAFVRSFELDPGWVLAIDVLIASILLVLAVLVIMVIRQWHWASAICNWLYDRGTWPTVLDGVRLQVRLFENLIYGYYRRYPGRFLPIIFLEMAFHALGVIEVWFILTKISTVFPGLSAAFFLETVSRLITVVFKLIPFVIGVDEAGAELVVEALALGAGIGVTLAIVRKARIMSWAAFGVVLILQRGLTIREIRKAADEGAAGTA